MNVYFRIHKPSGNAALIHTMWSFDFLCSFLLIGVSQVKVRGSPSSGHLPITSTSPYSPLKKQKVSCQHNRFFQNKVGRKTENVTLIHTSTLYTNYTSTESQWYTEPYAPSRGFKKLPSYSVFSLAFFILLLALLSSEMTRTKENIQKSKA